MGLIFKIVDTLVAVEYNVAVWRNVAVVVLVGVDNVVEIERTVASTAGSGGTSSTVDVTECVTKSVATGWIVEVA